MIVKPRNAGGRKPHLDFPTQKLQRIMQYKKVDFLWLSIKKDEDEQFKKKKNIYIYIRITPMITSMPMTPCDSL